MRTSNVLKMMILTFLLSACSQGFQSKNLSASSMAGADSEGPSASGQSTLSSDTVITGRGELKTSQKIFKDKTVKLDFEMNIPFGRVYSALSSLVRTAVPYTCKMSSDLMSQDIDAYAPGEIPCGVPYSQDWKKLVDINIDEYRKKSGSKETRVYAFTLPVLLSRKQYRGTYSEDRLDNRRQESLTSSFGLGEDMSIRYQPEGMKSRTELCMNVPGTAVRSPEVKVRAGMKRRVLGVKVSHTSDFKVNPGQAKYDFGRGCFALDMEWVAGHGFTTDLTSTEEPHLVNVQYDGFNIRITDRLLKIIDSIMSFFKVSIREKIIKQVKSTVNKIADSDVETGAWFTRIQGEEMLEKSASKFNQKAREVIARIGAPANKEEFKAILEDNCRILKFGGEKWSKRMQDFCHDVMEKVDIDMEPFAVHEKSKALGCYDHFANIHMSQVNGSPQWWSTQCKFSAKVTVTVSATYRDYVAELRQVLEQHISQKQIPDKWKAKLEKLRVDGYKLSLLLKELEDRGVNQITDHDWTSTIPAVVAELREKDLLD